MAQVIVHLAGLPETPLDAAAAFFRDHLPAAREALGKADDLLLVFEPAGHDHRGWRLAAVQELAREAAPRRVNALAGDDAGALADAAAYLAAAGGVTGQLLAVDGKAAENG